TGSCNLEWEFPLTSLYVGGTMNLQVFASTLVPIAGTNIPFHHTVGAGELTEQGLAVVETPSNSYIVSAEYTAIDYVQGYEANEMRTAITAVTTNLGQIAPGGFPRARENSIFDNWPQQAFRTTGNDILMS